MVRKQEEDFPEMYALRDPSAIGISLDLLNDSNWGMYLVMLTTYKRNVNDKGAATYQDPKVRKGGAEELCHFARNYRAAAIHDAMICSRYVTKNGEDGRLYHAETREGALLIAGKVGSCTCVITYTYR